MFTGIVIGLSKLIDIKKNVNFNTYIIEFPKRLLYKLNIGASVSNNGCCLTVKYINKNLVYFDVVQETLNCTNFKFLKIGDFINIERSLKLGDEIGGHLVSGHILTTAVVYKFEKYFNNSIMWFKIKDVNFIKYFFLKGFICINGVSLTLSGIKNNKFSVNLIPKTLEITNFFFIKKGDLVNIEIDFYTKIIVDQIYNNI